MSNLKTRTAIAAAGLAILGGTALGAGAATAGGDTTAPKPGPVCGTTSAHPSGENVTTVPCPNPTGGATFTLGADGKVRDTNGRVVGTVDPKTGGFMPAAGWAPAGRG